jgi:peroxiredoxin
MPSVQRVHEAFKDQEAVMLSISIDGGGLPAVKRYVDKHGFTMPILVDADMQFARQFGVRGVPTTVIVDRQGQMVASGHGRVEFDAPAFRDYIRGLLSASPR